MPYLITGATGYLGRHVLDALKAHSPLAQRAGDTLTADERHCVLVRRADDWARCPFAKAMPEVHVIEGSLSHPELWQDDARLKHVNGIFHLAAMVQHSRHDTVPVYNANVEGTLGLIRAAAHLHCRMIYVSTSGTVGVFNNSAASADEHAPLLEEAVRQWPYYHSKVIAEQRGRALATTLGVDLIILRPPMMLGPGDHRFRATGQIVRFLRRRLPFVVEGGIHYIDIRDAAVAMMAAMLHPKPQPVYNLPGSACGVSTFFEDVGRIAKRRPPKVTLPYKAAWSLAYASAALSRKLGRPPFFPDPVVIEMASHYWGVHSHYAADDLQFVSRPGRNTLEDTVAWIRAHRQDCG